MVLEILSWPYMAAVRIRNSAFDRGLLKTRSVSVPVISVGNLTVGGTGKTPLVEYIVGYCLSKGKKTAVVSRGYGRSTHGIVVVSDGSSVFVNAAEGGDEPVQTAKKFPRAIVVVGERRAEAANVAVQLLGADSIVLDDGFQHRYLRRDLDVVVVDSRRQGHTRGVLPAGRLREPWDGIRRAHVVALSKVDPAGADTPPVMGAVRECYEGPVILFHYKTDCVCRTLDGSRISLDEVKTRPVLAVSGIADPESFVEGLNASGFTVRGNVVFPDHHRYSLRDVSEITRAMGRCGAEICVTTEKDAVRMLSDSSITEGLLKTHNVYHTRIAVDMTRGESEFLSMIDSCLMKGGHS